MRSLLPSVPVLIAISILAMAAPAPAAAAGCAPSGSRLVSKNNDVRVYATTSRDTFVKETFVCSDRTGKRARIARQFFSPRGPVGDRVGAIRYAGHFFAAAISSGDSYGRNDAMIRRVDLDDGGQLRIDVCPQCPLPLPRFGPVGVTDLVLNRKGWIAWIGRLGSNPSLSYVARRDSRGNALLDGGTDIEPRSLADSGTTIFWNAHGEPQNQDLY